MQELGPNQKRWIAALRSGEYAQGQRALHEEGRFCCLGVACHIFKEELGIEVTYHGEWYEYDDCRGAAPTVVCHALGLYNGMGALSHDDYDSLALRNDFGTTFTEIADLLESAPSMFFKEPK